MHQSVRSWEGAHSASQHVCELDKIDRKPCQSAVHLPIIVEALTPTVADFDDE